MRFQNITCEGENGIFILGSPDNWIEDVSFDGVTLTLDRRSKWEITGYDTRPCQGDGEIKTKVSGIYVDYGKNITFRNTKIATRKEFRSYYKEDATLRTVENVRVELED